MKILRKITCNNIGASTKSVESYIRSKVTDYIYSDEYMTKMLNGIDKYLAKRFSTVADIYQPYIDPKNILVVVNYRPEFDFNIASYVMLHVPVPAAYAFMLADYFEPKYLKYMSTPKVNKFLEDNGLKNKFVYQYMLGAGLEADVVDESSQDAIVDELISEYQTNITDIRLSSWFMVSKEEKEPTHNNVPMAGPFMRYINEVDTASKRTSKKTNAWKNIVDQLVSESEEDINSIYEETDAGAKIDDIAKEVEDSLGIYGEPSIQAGRGGIFFYDNNTGDVLLRMDYEVFCNDLISMAIESSSKKEFVEKLKSYYDI